MRRVVNSLYYFKYNFTIDSMINQIVDCIVHIIVNQYQSVVTLLFE
jgi:hypothetical protein